MAQEINEGIAYLMALKQGVGQTSATTAGPAQELGAPRDKTLADGEERYEGAEKRRSPRFRCEGSAEVREEGCDVRTWATFTDISLHGCYVEAQATYPPGTVLHLKLEANNLRFETKRVVRVTYPYLGMGISFEDVSEENREQIKRLLMTLSSRCLVMGPGIAPSMPSGGPSACAPLISDPAAVVQAIVSFFESRQVLMRDDFLRILSKSQSAK
jgi:hypothetical protein